MKVKLLKKLRKQAHDRFRVVYDARYATPYIIERYILASITVPDNSSEYMWKSASYHSSESQAIERCDKWRKQEFYDLAEEYIDKIKESQIKVIY